MVSKQKHMVFKPLSLSRALSRGLVFISIKIHPIIIHLFLIRL